jgi:hypothetical protein
MAEDGTTTQLMNITTLQDDVKKKFQSANQKPLDLKYYVENAIKSMYSCKRN